MKVKAPEELHSITFEGYYVDWIDIEDYRALYQQHMALREALTQIRDWEPDYSPVEKIYDKVQAEGECKECNRRSEKGWPPSGLCDRHYGILQMEAPKLRQDIYNGQHHDLKRIADKALRGES